eukprot:TRINITY_DN28968_c0_g1_i1.p1 TRINITY_DN28968_c0_g1~~TRINITY_DN28968_c0_g1_i1.p1  ORF type:complete len:325 (-),score=60.85 TRINITY_DN28968_c0_g1_i1:342-1316(-)
MSGSDDEQLVAIVTGANTGIGFHVAGELASGKHGAQHIYHVILACRNQERADEALQQLKVQYGEGVSAEVQLLDLASFASVRHFAAEFLKRRHRLDLLVCNAGINSASCPTDPDKQLTGDSVDLLYQTNFLAHLLLTLELMPCLSDTSGRVVSVTSVMHRSATLAQLQLVRKVREPYESLYGFSKLAQIAAGFELNKRFGSKVAFHCVNPGGVSSDIWRDFPTWQRWAMSAVFASCKRAASTVVRICICSEGRVPAEPMHANGYLGAGRFGAFEYWSPWSAADRIILSAPSEESADSKFGQKLWEESIKAFRDAGVKISDDGKL